jgi:hypothetical protein
MLMKLLQITHEPFGVKRLKWSMVRAPGRCMIPWQMMAIL